LSAEAVDGVLREIRQAAPGSVLLFTYIHRAVLENPGQFFGAEKMMSRLRSYGEPWTFGLYPEDLRAYLATRGLRLLKDLSVASVWQDEGWPSSDVHGYEFYRLAAVCVER
jgi:O-methyltransferase involved in polyketide biosynthesis